MMTLETIRSNLTAMEKDELTDVQKYSEIAKLMHDEGHDEYAQIFRDMAREEHTHAHHIREMAEDMGIKGTLADEWRAADKSIADV